MEDLSSPRHHEDEPAREPASHASRMSDVRGRVAKRARTVPTEREHFAPGATLVRQGEVGDRAWLVVAGTLQVVVKTGSAERQIGRIGPGGIVGEMSLVDDGTRTATVRAETPVVAVPIGRGTFERAFEQSPPLVRYLLETLIATLRRSYGLKSWERTEGSPMFRSTRHSSVVLQRRTLAAGHVFFRE